MEALQNMTAFSDERGETFFSRDLSTARQYSAFLYGFLCDAGVRKGPDHTETQRLSLCLDWPKRFL